MGTSHNPRKVGCYVGVQEIYNGTFIGRRKSNYGYLSVKAEPPGGATKHTSMEWYLVLISPCYTKEIGVDMTGVLEECVRCFPIMFKIRFPVWYNVFHEDKHAGELVW